MASRFDGTDPTLRITAARSIPAGQIVPTERGGNSPPLPAHCLVDGIIAERIGSDGQPYAITFRMRLPESWNNRFLFQGGGGTNGEVGEALGLVPGNQPPALLQGYAVVSQDSGHSNAINADPAKGGTAGFGMDAQARADYGGVSLKRTYDAAKAIIARFYGRIPAHSYYGGCSKGGQEGMVFAQRYPEAFDGIIAAAPGFALPKAAVAQAWSIQQLARVVRQPGEMSVPFGRLTRAFSDADMALVRTAVLKACDGADGLADGLTSNTAACTSDAVIPQLRAAQCAAGKQDRCISATQIDALVQILAGARDSRGTALYASFPWDAGLSDDGWRIWHTGLVAAGPRPEIPPLSATLGAGALATIFSVPPRVLDPGPQAGMDFMLGYDFDRDAPRIFATSSAYPRSAWTDISARSTDLSAFRAHGGKLIVPHGGADPVFSLLDTQDWWAGVNTANGGRAADFARVFPVPGMGHCQGGPATDTFDALSTLVAWVERGEAPDRIVAKANPQAPWPHRSRPLCPYPKVARPISAKADPDRAEDFICR